MSVLMACDTVTGDRGSSWMTIRRMSRQLLNCARNSDWKAAVELQARRDGLIRGFFSNPVGASEADSVREGILEILAMDKEVMKLTREGRAKVGAKIYQLHCGRKAQKVYADTQNGI
jgi:hypothetical protein